MAMGASGRDYSAHDGLEAERAIERERERENQVYNLQSHAPSDLLPPARPTFQRFYHLPEQHHQLRTNHSTHESVGTFHMQIIMTFSKN
jgi:hypothetical protein